MYTDFFYNIIMNEIKKDKINNQVITIQAIYKPWKFI